MKKVFLLLTACFLLFVGCKDDVTIFSVMHDIGSDSLSYPSWFEAGTYELTSDSSIKFCFFTDTFKFDTIQQQLSLEAKKVKLEVIDDNSFSLEMRNDFYTLKFIIEKECDDRPKITRDYREHDGSVEMIDDWGWIKKIG